MTVRLVSQSPETRGLAAADAAIALELAVEAGASARSLATKVGGVTVATWSGGTPTVAAGYQATVLLDETRLTFSLTRDGGWTHGAAVAWSVAYGDSLTAVRSFEGSFARVGATVAALRPGDGASGVARRPVVYAEATFDAGTPLGVDLEVGGEPAILWGVPVTPAFAGRAGVVGSAAHGLAQPRRAFAPGARVELVVRPVVSVGGTAYRGRAAYAFAVAPRAARPSLLPDVPPDPHPVRETVRLVAASALRPDGGSPNLATALAFYATRAEVGALVRHRLGAAGDLAPADVADAATLAALVEHVRPLWSALLDTAPPEAREALGRAWASGHVVEQVGAVAVVLFGGP